MAQHILDLLKERGFIAQMTFEDELYEQLKNPTTFYVGFDPTADSLHIGHYIPIMAMAHMQRAGHRPIALMGGGTAMIGDPSGKTDMRKMMTVETIDNNVAQIKKQMSRFLDFSEGKAIIVNNGDWLRNLNFIEFMRDIGSMFSVNKMLTADCYKARMATDNGLSFLEFTYMLMQSYDFLELFKNYGCRLEMGGNDQWSNMLGGTELIRRKLGKDAHAMTITLLLNSEGKKMGKTAKGAVWLDPNKTTPFDFFQYWRNIDDADVMKCLRMLTFLPLEEINAMEGWEGSQLNKAKEILAYELTKLVHGEEEANKARDAAKALFLSGANDADMPTTELTESQLTDGRIGILDLMLACKLAPTKSEARRLVQQGGVFADDEKVASIDVVFTAEQLKNGVKLRKGKKVFHKAVLAC